jgi:predicted ATPase with chaperone activity
VAQLARRSAHDKVLRVARTIADLAGEERLSATHLSEAIHYRRLDRSLRSAGAAKLPLNDRAARTL